MPESKELILYCDGSSQGNPGPAGAGVILLERTGEKVVECSQYLGELTNNEAEYKALALGLEEALVFKLNKITVFMDSELVVRQINGEYRVRDPGLKRLHAIVKTKLMSFGEFKVSHVRREKMTDADRLAKLAVKSYLQSGRCRKRSTSRMSRKGRTES